MDGRVSEHGWASAFWFEWMAHEIKIERTKIHQCARKIGENIFKFINHLKPLMSFDYMFSNNLVSQSLSLILKSNEMRHHFGLI